MWARKRIDIGWTDLLSAVWYLLRGESADRAREACEQAWTSNNDSIVSLSVRSGFDLYLSVLDLPPGSEVIISAVTILDMAKILEEHCLIPIPVDLNIETMAPEPDDIEAAITGNTRAILIAHLFGSVLDLSPIVKIAREHGLIVIEDCAQAFDGDRYRGHPDADVSMFSFGPIKTATALAGGILTVRNLVILSAMQAQQATYPVQQRRQFAKRILCYGFLKWLGGKNVFGAFVMLCRILKIDFERLLSGAVRNFPSVEFFDALRQHPSAPLSRLLRRRFTSVDHRRLDQRSKVGWKCVDTLQDVVTIPGRGNPRSNFWVFPILAGGNREMVIESLRSAGFDATAGGQMRVVPPPEDSEWPPAMRAIECLDRLIFLPLEPEMSDRDIERMSAVIRSQVRFNPTTGLLVQSAEQ